MRKKKEGSEFDVAYLGRGILRTLKRDIFVIGIGVAVGAGLAAILGFTIKLGVLSGAFIGLLFRIFFSYLFEYDDPPSNGN